MFFVNFHRLQLSQRKGQVLLKKTASPLASPLATTGSASGPVCYRCGQRGHLSASCPNPPTDPAWDKPKIKKTTGIPKTFLQTVKADKLSALAASNVMMTNDGSIVVARLNDADWQKMRQAAQKAANIPTSLRCPLCQDLFVEAVRVACCGKAYCDECVRDLDICPANAGQASRHGNPNPLRADEALRERCRMYVLGFATSLHHETDEDDNEEQDDEQMQDESDGINAMTNE